IWGVRRQEYGDPSGRSTRRRSRIVKTFRASISTLGILVLIIAFDCAVLRFAFGSNDRTWLDLFALPMLNVLMLTFAHRLDRRRGGNRTPFLDGFLWLGWAALGLYLIWCRIRPEETIWALAVASESVHWLTLDSLDFDTMRRVDPTFRLAWKISKAAQ